MKPRPHSLLVLATSGLLGFHLGWVGFPDWQVAVETAQVVARVVRYPSPTPFYVYHVKLWTILHQLLAVGLRLGVSEIRLSLIVSGLVGMLSFQALSMVVYALSRDVLLAIGSAFLIFLSRSSEFGATYPIYLMGATDTYGMVGLSLCALIAGLFGAGSNRAALFLAGIAPAVHPSLGLWFNVILVICFAWDRESRTERLRPAWKYFVAGCVVTGLSFLAQVAMAHDVPPIDGNLAKTYMTEFVRSWDGHRVPVPLGAAGVTLNVCALTLAAAWLAALSTDLSRSAAFLLRIVIVAAVLSITFMFVSWISPDRLPANLLILMPSRLLNFDAMLAVAVVIGLIGAYRRSIWSPALLVLLSSGLMLGARSMLWTWLERHKRVVAFGGTNTLLILGIMSVALIALALTGQLRREASSAALRTAARVGRGLWLALFLVLMGFGWQIARPVAAIFGDRTTDPLFRVAAEGHGILLTAANLHLIQLRTRRPVLIDGGGLDGLPYSLEAAPDTERVLRDVYGIDFFHPPEEARGGGMIPPEATQVTWEGFSVDEWRTISRRYHVTQVMASAYWTLRLPVLAQNRQLRLYSIPE